MSTMSSSGPGGPTREGLLHASGFTDCAHALGQVASAGLVQCLGRGTLERSSEVIAAINYAEKHWNERALPTLVPRGRHVANVIVTNGIEAGRENLRLGLQVHVNVWRR